MFIHVESGQPKQPLERGFIAEELNVEEDKNSCQVWVANLIYVFK